MKKEISKRKMRVVLGIFLAIFSVILFINVTVFPRIFTFGFAYLFGIGSYLVYIAIYCIGMKLIFTKQKSKFKIPLTVILGSIVFLLGAFTLVTVIFGNNGANSTDKITYITFISNSPISSKRICHFANEYNSIFFTFEDGKNYLLTPSINFFSANYKVGGGLFGYLLLACGNSMFGLQAGGIIFAIILFSLAFIIFFSPLLVKIIKNARKNAPKKSRKGVKNSEEEEELEPYRPSYSMDQVDPDDIIPEENDYDEPISNNGFGFGVTDNTVNGSFVRPIFSLGENDNVPQSEPVVTPISNPNPAYNQPAQAPIQQQVEPQVAPRVVEETQPEPQVAYMNQEMNEEVEERVSEQPFVAPEPAPLVEEPQAKKLDESLVTAAPQFSEPQSKQIDPMAQANVAQTPVKRERVNWIPPSVDLLNPIEPSEKDEQNKAVAEQRKEAINEVFRNFNIGARIENYIVGSAVTRFNVAYEANVTQQKVANIVPDISIRLGGVPARFVPIVEGQSSSGLEISNAAVTMVTFKEVFSALPDVKKHPLSIAFGKDIGGKVVCADFNDFPHILVAGTTGSGKSIFVNSIIATLIMRNSPDDLRIVLVDPKTVEMTRYKDMPHLLCPILYTPQEAFKMAKKLQEEMERRYKLFSSSNGATNINEYNEDAAASGLDRLPYIIFVLDEYADLIDQCKELSMPVVSLAQKARACGIHLMISTQRPSTNVVTGTIKANMPTHVALMTSNATDSITIIGEGGAEKLLGRGDMLVQSPLVSRVGCVRLQGCYADRGEIVHVVNYLKEHYETVYDPFFMNLEDEAEEKGQEYVETAEFQSLKEGSEEERYQQIKEWAMTQEFMSISRIQRQCAVGFNRAGRFFLRMQEEGIVDKKVEGNKGCRVLIQDKFGDDTEEVISDEQSYYREDD